MEIQLKNKLRKTKQLNYSDYEKSVDLFNDGIFNYDYYFMSLEKITLETYKKNYAMLVKRFMNPDILKYMSIKNHMLRIDKNTIGVVNSNNQYVSSRVYIPDSACIIKWFDDIYSLIVPQINSLHCRMSDDNNLIINLSTNQNFKNFITKLKDDLSKKIERLYFNQKILNTNFEEEIKVYVKNKCHIFKRNNNSKPILVCYKKKNEFEINGKKFDSREILPKNEKINIILNIILICENNVYKLVFFAHQIEVMCVLPYYFKYKCDCIIIT